MACGCSRRCSSAMAWGALQVGTRMVPELGGLSVVRVCRGIYAYHAFRRSLSRPLSSLYLSLLSFIESSLATNHPISILVLES